MAKSCKKGYYYCHTDKKCKKIPKGWHVMPTGYIMRDSEHKDENKDETEGKKKNGNGNGANGNGNGNGGSNGGSNGGGVSEAWSAKYKKSIDCNNPKGFSQKAHCRGREVNEAKNGDHEVAMAQSQLKKSEENIKKLRKALGNKEKDLPAWMQAKITDTAHDTDAAAGYVDKMNEQMTQQDKAEYMAKRLVNKARGVAAQYDAAKKRAENVKTTSGSVTVREGTLHKWFKGSKSKDGKGGWVNVTTGGTCASDEPGEGVPKCVSRSKYESMTPAERRSASRRKKKKDKGQQSKRNAAKPTYVATDKPRKKMKESYSNWRADLEQLDEMGLANAARIGGALGLTAAGGVLVNKAKEAAEKLRNAADKRMGKPPTYQKNSYQPEGEDIQELGGLLDRVKSAGREVAVKTGERVGERVGREKLGPIGGMIGKNKGRRTGGKAYDQATSGDVGGAINTVRDALSNSYEPEGEIVEEGKDRKGKGSGTKDACYHKVKSRYSVWPSAYASGALVKCRKVGAANWGNSKKESFSNWREDMLLEGIEDKLRGMSASQIEDLIRSNPGAEEKIRATLAKMRSATPNPQGRGAQLPNVPKQPASTSSATPRETYQRGGSDRVSYQRRQTVTRADVQGGTEAAKRAASGQGRYKPGVGVTPDFKLDPKFKPPGSRGMRGGVRPRGRGGKIGLAVTAAGLAAPFVVGAIKRAFNKEDYDYSNWRDDFHATEVESVDLISNEPLQPTQGLGSDMLGEAQTKQDKLKEISKQLAGASKMHAQQSKKVAQVADNLEEAKKCWKGYKKAGTQKLFGKTYNRCVKAHFSDWRAEMDLQEKKEKKNCGCGKDPCETYGNQKEVKEDWQKSNRKDGVDGMSQKSVNAYRRENPGSKLQTAVTGKVKKGSKDAKRRKSFCARSKGQMDMHNIDCKKTPEKKICKARKRWRC